MVCPSDINYINQPIREALPTLKGCLVAPKKDFCLFFILVPISVIVDPIMVNQLWYCTEEGIPSQPD